MNFTTTADATRRASTYSGDVFAYSLPGGFARARPWDAAAPPATPLTAVPDVHVPETDGERTVVVTDVACDLPPDWLAAQGIVLLPNRLRFDSRTRSDVGDPHAALEFFRHDLANLRGDAQSLPLSVSGAQEFIIERLRSDSDLVIAISIASHRGGGYLNSLNAAQNLMLAQARARRLAGIVRPFKMWVIDSTTAFNGQGVLVTESVRLLKAGMTVPRVVQHVDALRKRVHTLLVPRDPMFFRRHHHLDGDSTLNWLSLGVGAVLDRTPVVHARANALTVAAQARGYEAAVARALDATRVAADEGLLAPSICVSYAGDVAELHPRPAFQALTECCQRQRIALHVATMSMTNALEVGGGAVTIAFASDKDVLSV